MIVAKSTPGAARVALTVAEMALLHLQPGDAVRTLSLNASPNAAS